MRTSLVIQFPTTPPLYLGPAGALTADHAAARRFPASAPAGAADDLAPADLHRLAVEQARDAASRLSARATIPLLEQLGAGDLNRGRDVLGAARVVEVTVREVVELGAVQ